MRVCRGVGGKKVGLRYRGGVRGGRLMGVRKGMRNGCKGELRCVSFLP